MEQVALIKFQFEFTNYSFVLNGLLCRKNKLHYCQFRTVGRSLCLKKIFLHIFVFDEKSKYIKKKQRDSKFCNFQAYFQLESLNTKEGK